MANVVEIPERTESHVRPTPDEVDELAKRYLEAVDQKCEAQRMVTVLEGQLTQLVNDWGVVLPRSEKSRHLVGIRARLKVTKSDTLTIQDERVETLKEVLDAAGFKEYFPKLFVPRTKWEMVKGAADALKSDSLPKRLAEKVLNLWGRCIKPTPKKPSLTVTLADPAKPAKKSRKAGA